jgi:ubiquinone/menaquinone biosynthesis C-methylase UbiE
MVRTGEIEHGRLIAGQEESVWHWGTPAGRQRVERRARLIGEAAALAPHTRALELGCGTGIFTRQFAATGAHMIAIDVSPELLAIAAEKECDGAIAYRIDDAESMSFDNASFDAVVGSSVLHHLHIDQALLEIRRVLKPGGRLAFAEPNMMNPQIVFERSTPLVRRWLGVSPEETAFFRWSLAAKLRAAGFTDVRVEPHDFLHPSVPAPLIPMVRRVGGVLEALPLVREIAGSLLICARRDTAD